MFFKKRKPPETQHLTTIVERMRLSGIAKYSEFQGIDQAKILKLEEKYNLELPQTYREFLKVMGWKAGLLLQGDHHEIFYDAVLELTEEFNQDIAEMECGRHRLPDNSRASPPLYSLPENALIISQRLGEGILFIICEGQTDSPVFELDNLEWKIEQTQDSVIDWLDSLCTLTEADIKSGFYNP